jgi:hypothetical protein
MGCFAGLFAFSLFYLLSAALLILSIELILMLTRTWSPDLRVVV